MVIEESREGESRESDSNILTMPEPVKGKGEIEKKDKHLILGSIPKLNEYFMHLAWAFCREEIENLRRASGDFEVLSDIWQDIFFGRSFLYMGFAMESEKEIDEKDFQVNLLECLTKKNSAEFVGFFILKMEERNFHLWQAHIVDAYKGTSVFKKAYTFLEKQVKDMGAPSLTFSTHLTTWGPVAKRLGFKRILELYKKDL